MTTELGISAEQPERLQEKNPNIVAAEEKLNSLLTFYLSRDSLFWKSTIERHRSTVESRRQQDGNDSIASILPLNTFEFDYIPNILARARIRTKGQLVGLNEDEIGEIRGVGVKRKEIILAMRDLAIAEIEERKPRQLQIFKSSTNLKNFN